MSKEVKTTIKKFINKVIDKDYKTAHENLSNAISSKIKQQIINNNIDLF
jgi:hypothetical protein